MSWQNWKSFTLACRRLKEWQRCGQTSEIFIRSLMSLLPTDYNSFQRRTSKRAANSLSCLARLRTSEGCPLLGDLAAAKLPAEGTPHQRAVRKLASYCSCMYQSLEKAELSRMVKYGRLLKSQWMALEDECLHLEDTLHWHSKPKLSCTCSTTSLMQLCKVWIPETIGAMQVRPLGFHCKASSIGEVARRMLVWILKGSC